MIRLLLAGACLLAGFAAHAHKPSDSYLAFRVAGGEVTGQWDIALRDLDFVLGLDTNGDGAITWGELRSRHDAVAAYALSRLSVHSGAALCPLRVTDHLVDHHSDGTYAVLKLAARCPDAPQILSLDYRLLFDVDPQHKGLLRLERGERTLTGIFSPEQPRQNFNLASAGRLATFLDYGGHGVWHIWIGFDHVLFLLALLLPAVLMRGPGGWVGAQRFRPAFWEVLKVVTAFTVAHSLTLTLAALEWVQIPSRLAESLIAASVVLAALNNLFPVFREGRWVVAFGFGLLHGFGFASVLSDLGLPKGALLLALVGFNLGVEIGQLVIVAAFLPLAYGLRNSGLYKIGVFRLGSLAIALLALIWLAERVFNWKIISP